MRGQFDFECRYNLSLTCKHYHTLKKEHDADPFGVSLGNIMGKYSWCPPNIIAPFKTMVQNMGNPLDNIDITISGSTIVQAVLCKQWESLDIDMYLTIKLKQFKHGYRNL